MDLEMNNRWKPGSRCIFFDPEMTVPLKKVLNYLNPEEFITLIMASKKMYKRCLSLTGVEIPFTLNALDVRPGSNKAVGFRVEGRNFRDILSPSSINALTKLPFVVHLNDIYFVQRVNKKLLGTTEKFISALPVKSIYHLHVKETVVHWEELLEFAKAYGVKNLDIDDGVPVFDVDLLKIFTADLEDLGYCRPVPINCLLSSRIPTIGICNSELRLNDAKALVKNWIESDVHIHEWELADIAFFPGDLGECFDGYTQFDYEYSGDILKEQKPLVFVTREEFGEQTSFEYGILREDGETLVVRCSEWEGFHMGSPVGDEGVPPRFRR